MDIYSKKNFVIIDNDISSQTLISGYLNQMSCVNVLETFSSVKAASTYVHQHVVDIVLISTHNNDGSFLDFLSTLVYRPFVVVLSEYADYAVQALNLGAIDYLVKPLSENRLQMAINKIFYLQNYRALVATAQESNFSTKIEGKSRSLAYSDILFFEAYGNYVKWYGRDGKMELIFEKISSVEERLCKRTFVRVHKSFIVNVKAIEKIEKDTLLFPLGHVVPVGKFYKKSFFEGLEAL